MTCRRIQTAALWTFVLWAFLSIAAQAQTARDVCAITSSGNTPPTTITMDQTVNAGDALGSGWMMLAPLAWECTRTADATTDLHVQPVVTVADSGTAAGTTMTHAGETYRLFTRTQNGEQVGYIARWRSTIHGQTSGWWPVTEAVLQPDARAAPVRVAVPGHARYTASIEIQVRMIKTHAHFPTPNATIHFTPLQAALATQRKPSGASMHDAQPAQAPTLSVTFAHVNRACTTPNVDVQLPTINTNALPRIGSTGPTTTFDLRFANCPAALRSIDYQFQSIPHQTIRNGELPLLNTSSAIGVRVQVLDANNDPLTFDAPYALTAYDPAQDAATYVVPLGVRLIRTHSVIKPGSVHAAMNMTVEYK